MTYLLGKAVRAILGRRAVPVNGCSLASSVRVSRTWFALLPDVRAAGGTRMGVSPYTGGVRGAHERDAVSGWRSLARREARARGRTREGPDRGDDSARVQDPHTRVLEPRGDAR